MFPLPIFMVAGPLLLAVPLFLLRRWPQIAAVAGVVAALLLHQVIAHAPFSAAAAPAPALVARFVRGDTWFVLGRLFLVDEATRDLFLLLLALLALLYLLSFFWFQGSAFVPASLALLSPLAAASMVRPFAFGVIFLLIAAAILAWLVQAGRTGSTQAALRSLLMVALAVPPLLVAGWMLEAEAIALSIVVARLMALGFIILLAGFPFHIWVTTTLTEAFPLTAAVAFGLVHLVLLLFIFNLLLQWPFIGQDPAFVLLLRWSGILTVVVAVLLAYHAPTFGSLLAYLLLVDVGATLILLALDGPRAAAGIFSLLFLRLVGLIVAGSGLSLIRGATGSSTFTAARGAVQHSPLGVVLYVYGGLSLAGLPLTPGFTGRWSVVDRLAQETAVSPATGWLVLLLLLVGVSGTIGLMRALRLLLAAPPGKTLPGAMAAELPAARRLSVPMTWHSGAAAIILLGGFVIALFPQVLLAHILSLAALF
jgi:formate hydrogenlyase subunit 3/multisubunit Na+/H+ antiporter MnhD subunit